MDISPAAIDRLERAIVEETRVQLSRRGTEYVVLPLELRSDGGREILVGTTAAGDDVEFILDELEYFDVID